MRQHHIFALRHRAKIALANGDIVFTNSHGLLERIPLSRVNALSVSDTARLSLQTLCLLLRMGITVTFLAPNNEIIGHAAPGPVRNSDHLPYHVCNV